MNFIPEFPGMPNNGMIMNNDMNYINNIFNKFSELENKIKKVEQRITRLENESNNNHEYTEPDNSFYMI